MKDRSESRLHRVRATVMEVLYAMEKHFEIVCGEDNERLQDVIDGIDISLQKLRGLLKTELSETSKPKGTVRGRGAIGRQRKQPKRRKS